jgi:hypothetical protein
MKARPKGEAEETAAAQKASPELEPVLQETASGTTGKTRICEEDMEFYRLDVISIDGSLVVGRPLIEAKNPAYQLGKRGFYRLRRHSAAVR